MTEPKRIYVCTYVDDNVVRAGQITLNSDGSARIEVLDSAHDEVVIGLQDGILHDGESRWVLPREGAVFIEAIEDSLARSSYWFTQRE